MIPNPNSLKSPIFHMQQFLRTISQSYSEISPVVPDGAYGPQTTQAVMDFQKMQGLAQTGAVNFETWKGIIDTYDDVMNQNAPAKAVRSFPAPDHTISLGDESDTVYFIQVMLNTLASHYVNISPVRVTGKYDEQTAQSIRNFQPCCGEECNGVVCKNTWNMLVNAYETCIRFC